MAKGSKSSSPGKGRSAVSGQYVKPSYVAGHKSTTVVEHDRPKGGGGKKK